MNINKNTYTYTYLYTKRENVIKLSNPNNKMSSPNHHESSPTSPSRGGWSPFWAPMQRYGILSGRKENTGGF